MSEPLPCEANRRERVRQHRDKARAGGVAPDALVDEDAHENGRLVERMARRDHPHSDHGERPASHATARIPPRRAHVWLWVLLLLLAGALLSWWGIAAD